MGKDYSARISQGRVLLAVSDYGAPRTYAESIMQRLCEALNVKPINVVRVDHIDRSKSSELS